MRTAMQRWAWFRESVDTIIGSTWSAEYESIADEINRLSDQAIARSGRRRVPLSIRRTIADLRVLAAHKKRRPLAECEGLYVDRVQLGFSTLAYEAIAVGAHARYLRQIGERAAAGKYVAGILKNVEASRRTAKPP